MSSGIAKAQEQLPTLESEAPSSEGREEGKELISHLFTCIFKVLFEARRTNLEGLVRARVPALTFKGALNRAQKQEEHRFKSQKGLGVSGWNTEEIHQLIQKSHNFSLLSAFPELSTGPFPQWNSWTQRDKKLNEFLDSSPRIWSF